MNEALSTTQDSSKQGIYWRPILVTLFNHSILILFTVIIVYPVLWMVLASFKTPGELVSNIWGIPASPAIQNYVDAWEKAKLGRSLLNSGIVSLGSVLLVVCVTSIAGYAFAKFSFRFSTVILLIFVFTMQAPTPIIPFYVLFVRLKLTDSYLGLILAIAAGAIPLSIFIFQAFFRSIPGELREAAKIDGCSEFCGVFARRYADLWTCGGYRGNLDLRGSVERILFALAADTFGRAAPSYVDDSGILPPVWTS